jgi:CDP-glucose 4,6-dehydratase
LDAVRQLELGCPVLVVTSDKCYENQGWEFGYRENDAMGGHDIYSASKGAAELVAQSWRRAFFAPNPRLGAVATARAGNVIGGGDYAQDRIIPDCIRSLIASQAIPIRNPQATRPWQHVLDCLSGYLWLGARLAMAPKDSAITGSFNFGPGPQANLPVKALVEELLQHWPGQWRNTGDINAPAEAHRLNLCIDKAAHLLQWHPTWDYAAAIRETVQWYHHRHVNTGQDMDAYSCQQINRFTQAARQKGLAWANPSPTN